jgi:hypothetical protein
VRQRTFVRDHPARGRYALAKSARASSNVVDVPDWISPSFDKINETAQIQVNRRERPDGSNVLPCDAMPIKALGR